MMDDSGITISPSDNLTLPRAPRTDPRALSSIPRPSSSVTPAARLSKHGAPTLLGGETAGDTALIRVWSSSRPRIAANAAMRLLLFTPLLLGALSIPGIHSVLLLSFLSIPFAVAVSWNLFRPTVVAADGSGIAMTRGGASQSLRWSEIRALSWEHSASRDRALNLYTHDTRIPLARGPRTWGDAMSMPMSAKMTIPGAGLSRKDRNALLAYIILEANLVPHPFWPQVFVSASYVALAKAQAGQLGQPPRPAALPAPESRIAAGLQWDLLTEQSRRVLADAYHRAAQEPAHDTAPEHLLTAILAHEECIAAQILRSFGVCLDQPAAPERPPLTPGPSSLQGARLHPRLHGVVETALQQARQSGRNFIGTEHLLVGLLLEGYGPAFQALIAAGVTPGGVMEAMER